LGAFHTIELALGRSLTLDKTCWDTIYMERVELACDPKRSAEVAAVSMNIPSHVVKG
jgi:protein pelota